MNTEDRKLYDSNTWKQDRKEFIAWAKSHTTQDAFLHRPSMMTSNFAHVSDALKVYVMDTITDHAKDVFGPFGGLYGELRAPNINAQHYNLEDMFYIKSKDGHNFFNSLGFKTHYGNTIMKMIQQMTKYIAGYEGETSRDGTTSLAMVSSILARNLLIHGNAKFQYKSIPSQILKEMEEIIKYCGTLVIEENKLPIYDHGEYQMIGNENGYDIMLNAIRTTTEDHPVVTQFQAIMDRCKSQSLDILNMHKGAPRRDYGNPNIFLNVKVGCKLRMEALSSEFATMFHDHTSYLFVLDGYIEPQNRDIYVYYFRKWIKELVETKDEHGNYLFCNPEVKAPIILVTRTPDYLLKFYEEIMMKGIDLVFNQNGQMQRANIKPIIAIAPNTEFNEVYFHDVMEVFHRNLININNINRFINTHRKSEQAFTPTGGYVSVKENEMDLSSQFPTIGSDGKIHYQIASFEKELDLARPDRYQNDTFLSLEDVSIEKEYFYHSMTFDGNAFHMSPFHPKLHEDIYMYRNQLLEIQKSLNPESMIEHNIDKRLDMFSGISLDCTIMCRSEDEWNELFAIYEDALGVFESGHAHGVCPGANTMILKYQEELRERIQDQMKYQFAQCSKECKEKYQSICNIMTETVIQSYAEVYSYLDRDQYWNTHTAEYHALKDKNLYVYDANAGTFRIGIFEAARTTRDVFHGALTIAFDMLRLKRIKVNTNSEWNEVNALNKEIPYMDLYQTENREEK